MKRLAVVLVLGLGLGLMSMLFASAASAQDCPTPDIADFTDPDTGEVDIEAYTAALACPEDLEATPAATGLARTGSNTTELALAGAALILVGGTVVFASRMRSRNSEA